MHLQRDSCKFLLPVFIFFFSLMAAPSFSLAIDSEVQTQNAKEKEVTWQAVCFHSSSTHYLKAELPVEAHKEIQVFSHCMYSSYGTSEYEVCGGLMADTYLFPSSEEEFRADIEESIDKEETCEILPVSDPVYYAAQIVSRDKDSQDLIKIERIYITNDQRIYFATVIGQDFSLAEDFFNKIHFLFP